MKALSGDARVVATPDGFVLSNEGNPHKEPPVSLGIRRMIAQSTPAATAGMAVLFGMTATGISAQERFPVSGSNVAIYNLAGRIVLGQAQDPM
jgi:hypothetical protein